MLLVHFICIGLNSHRVKKTDTGQWNMDCIYIHSVCTVSTPQISAVRTDIMPRFLGFLVPRVVPILDIAWRPFCQQSFTIDHSSCHISFCSFTSRKPLRTAPLSPNSIAFLQGKLSQVDIHDPGGGGIEIALVTMTTFERDPAKFLREEVCWRTMCRCQDFQLALREGGFPSSIIVAWMLTLAN